MRDRNVARRAEDSVRPIRKTTHDGLGRKRQVTKPLGNVTNLARNAASQSSWPQCQQYGYDEQARLLKLEQGYGTRDGTKWTFSQYSSFHDFLLDEQGNWAEHQDGAGTTLVSPTIAKDNAYAAWPVSGGSMLSFVLDNAGRFLVERPVAGGGSYLYKHDGLGRLVSEQRISAPGKPDLTTTYGYTEDGRLAWRKEGVGGREWLIDDGSQAVCRRPTPR